MLKKLMLLCFMAAFCCATQITGLLVHPTGGVPSGTIVLTPPLGVSLLAACGGTGGQGYSGQPTTITIVNGAVSGNNIVLGTDCFSPSNTSYDVLYTDTTGARYNSSWQIAGSTFSLSSAQFVTPGTLVVPSLPLFAQYVTATVANTATETTLLSTGNGSAIIPKPLFVIPGYTLKVTVLGFHSATSSPTITLRLYIGTSVLLTTGTVTAQNGSNIYSAFVGYITFYGATGPVAELMAQGTYTEAGASFYPMVNTTYTVSNSFLNGLPLNITVQWGTAATGNSFTATNVLIEHAT